MYSDPNNVRTMPTSERNYQIFTLYLEEVCIPRLVEVRRGDTDDYGVDETRKKTGDGVSNTYRYGTLYRERNGRKRSKLCAVSSSVRR